jgi:hypothetical protein
MTLLSPSLFISGHLHLFNFFDLDIIVFKAVRVDSKNKIEKGVKIVKVAADDLLAVIQDNDSLKHFSAP